MAKTTKKDEVMEQPMENQVDMEQITEDKQPDPEATPTVETLTMQVEKILAEARAAAAAIVEEAKEAAAELNQAKAVAAPQAKGATDPYYDELVPVMLFKDNNKYKDDVFVAVNGESCLIQRGKQVMIKRKFALVLEGSQYQDMATADYINGMEQEYKEKEAKLTN